MQWWHVPGTPPAPHLPRIHPPARHIPTLQVVCTVDVLPPERECIVALDTYTAVPLNATVTQLKTANIRSQGED